MRINFFGPDPAYHLARRHFVFKGKPAALPSRRDPLDFIARGSAVEAASDGFASQSDEPLEEDCGSPAMAQAWLNMLPATIRRILATAQ